MHTCTKQKASCLILNVFETRALGLRHKLTGSTTLSNLCMLFIASHLFLLREVCNH